MLLSVLECDGAELSVLITDDAEIAELNASYRNKAKPTDVLSFPLDALEEKPTDSSLGDVVISVPTLVRQAKAFKVTPGEEWLRLLIHGVLHLLGYEHERVDRNIRRRMQRKEEELRILLAPLLLGKAPQKIPNRKA